MATATPTLPVINATAAVTGTAAITATGTIAGGSPAPGEPTLIPTHTLEPTRAPGTPTPRVDHAAGCDGRLLPSQPDSTSGGVTLLRPPEGEKIIGAATFAWQDQPGFKLRPGQQYELIVWGLDEDPMRDGRSPVGGTGPDHGNGEPGGRRRGVAFVLGQELLLGRAAVVGQ